MRLMSRSTEKRITQEEIRAKERRQMIDNMLAYCSTHNDDVAHHFLDWLLLNLDTVEGENYTALKFNNHEYIFEYFNGYSWGKVSHFHDYVLDY